MSYILFNYIYAFWISYKLNTIYNNYKMTYRILNIILMLIISFIEGVAPWYSVITYKSNKNKFDIIKKD